ncbi:hypothetical protein B566_EDAN005525 [Ephemera danica]|nr:hypothetical protein B566_EDAN005525 [Ephemera danica]
MMKRPPPRCMCHIMCSVVVPEVLSTVTMRHISITYIWSTPPFHQEAPTKSHSTCSDGSLLSMGSSEMDEDSQVSGHSSKVSLHDRAPPPHEPAAAAFGGTDFDLEMVGESLEAPLSHSAARHKIAVRPRRTHGAPRHYRRTQQMSSMVLPTTPEANEEFPRNYSPDNRGKRVDPCLPEFASHADSCDTAEQQTSPEPMFRCSSPPNGGMPLPLFFHPNPRPSIPAGLSPNSPEALLASVMLERQLKSASLPPGLALPPAAPPASQEPTVKLSRSQSSADPAGSPKGRHNFRKAHSAARIEHQAALANEALSKSRAMFGGDAKEEKSSVSQPEPTSPTKEEKPLRSPVRKTSEDLPSPSHEEKSFVKPPPKPELPPSMKEDKPVFYKPPHSRKSEEPKSPVRLSEDMELPPVPGPKPETRKMSNVAMRQRIEPGLVSPEPPEEYSPPPWAPPSSSKMSTSHFIKLSDPCDADSLALRHKEMQERKFSSIKTRVSGFQTMLQDAPSSLDSLEIENQAARRLRSLSQSPVDSLERTELKMSSDSLSSGADLSSTSDDPRPYRKHSRPRRPTPDTSDPEETKPPPPVPRPIKLRSVSRHSDPPFSGKNAVEVTSVIRKSVSVDSIRSSYSENITENQSNIQLPTTKTSTSNDSISSYDTNDSEKITNIQEAAAPLPVTKVRSHLKSDTKPVDITPLESSHLSLKCESVKTETETSKSPPTRWENKLPRMSLSTPSVPEFLRVQLNHVDSTPASNVVLSANAASTPEVAAEPKRQRLPSDKQEEETENEITSARVRLRKSFIEEPKVVDIAEKKQEGTDSPAHILNRRPSQIKRLQELSLRVENDSKPQKIEVISPTEKVAPRAIASLVKETEAKPKTEVVLEKRYSSTFIQPKLSVATPQLKSVEAKPVKHNIPPSEPISNITIVSKATTVVSEPKESRANGVFTAKPVQTEKPAAPTPKQVVAPAPKVMAPPPKVVAVEKSEPAPEVVLRKKTSVSHEAKDDQPELMKVFARRSLKLKDTETWESQGSTQRSRDSDKENEDCPTEIREKKVVEAKSFNNSVANNNVPATVISNTNNNNNGFSRKVPRAVSMAAVPSNSNHTNNNLEAVNTEVTLRQRSPENRPRPSSLADRIQGVWGGRKVELVSSSAAAPAAPLPATVATDNTVDRSLTPRVRRRLDEWERWSKQTSRKEALPYTTENN